MAKYLIEETTLIAIGDAIRSKTGDTVKMTPTEMVTAISTIEGGGSGEYPADIVTATFMNSDIELLKRPVVVGDNCPDPVVQGRIETPLKESTETNTYTFNGWALTDGENAQSDILADFQDNRTVYAAYKENVRYYTVNFYDGETLLHTEPVAYGQSSDYVPKNKEGYAFVGWTPAPINIMGDLNCVATFVEAHDFANATWDYIAMVSESGTAADQFSLGDTKTITINLPDSDPIDMIVEIVGFNHDALSDGSGTAGISIMSKYLMPTPKRMMENHTATTPTECWENTELRAFCNEDLFNALPTALQSNIKQVKKSSNNKDGEISYVDDKCWVPSFRETGVYYTSSDDGSSKYPDNAYEGYTSGAVKLAKVPIEATGYFYYWWYRNVLITPYTDYSFLRQYSSQTTCYSYRKSPSDTSTYYCFGFCI